MIKKIIIIEDVYEDYLQIIEILKKYQVEYFPKPADFRSFSKLFVQYSQLNSQLKHEEDVEKIKEVVKSCNPDFIFLDIGLKFQLNKPDVSGLELKSKIFDKFFSQIPLFLVSRKTSDHINDGNYIYKRSNGTLAGEISRKFIAVHKIKLLSKPQIQPARNNMDETVAGPDLTDPIAPEVVEPERLGRLKRKLEYKAGPWVQTVIDISITYMFYLLLFALAFLGPVMIVINAIKDHYDVLHVAETEFLAFLPLLVVFGFFVFYKQSLRPMIVGADSDNVDHERASSLMVLTKKLFISSLISYLFTKLVELLFVDKSTNQKDINTRVFQQIYHTASPIVQIYVIGSVIVILMLFYVYLNNHKSGTREKQK